MAGLDNVASRDAITAGPSSYARIPQESDDRVPLVHLVGTASGTRPGTSGKQPRISEDDDDGGSEGDSGWHLDDLDDETYELAPNGKRSSIQTSDGRHKARTGARGDRQQLEAGRSDDDDDDDGEEEDALAMVRAVVSEDDDPTLPNLTFRVLVLGTILCAVGAAISQLFFVSELIRTDARRSFGPN